MGALVSTAMCAAVGCASSADGGRGREIIYVFEPLSEEELAAVKYPNLRSELLDMAREDQLTRTGQHPQSGDSREQMVATMTSVDRANTARMHEIVDEVGWPTISMVGSDGAQSSWLLVQHADLDAAFQRRCLMLMRKSRLRGEVYVGNLAYLTDRVLVNEGKKQEYGTQFHTVLGKHQPRPIRDAKNVDARRKEMGLSTLAEYEKLMKR